jgi:hypothetical protein
VVDDISAADPVGLSAKLALIDLLLRPVGGIGVRPLVLGLAAAGLLLSRLARDARLWLALTFLTGLRVVLDWPLADNHSYLLCFWCLALSLALFMRSPRESLALNGRLMIGLVFTLATVGKLISPDYLDGTFMRVTMVVDARFVGFTRIAAGLSSDQIEELDEFLQQHADGESEVTASAPIQPARFRAVARVATWWTLLIEGAVALSFLWPAGRGLSKWRDAALLTFCCTTYAAATVEGFGWLLIAMGVAQCEPGRTRTRLFYLGTFALILLYRGIPWAVLVGD